MPLSVAAERLARQGRLITFGIVPAGPETGYGYIKKGKSLGAKGTKAQAAYTVERFVEKPDLATAKSYVSSGHYLWNSGMFMFRTSAFLKVLRRFAPAILAACTRAYKASARDLDFLRLGEEAFVASPGDSIDYAVMEKTDSAVVVPVDAGWSDVGSWTALQDALPMDADGNVTAGDVIAEGTRGCYLHATSRLIAAVGLRDHVVVETLWLNIRGAYVRRSDHCRNYPLRFESGGQRDVGGFEEDRLQHDDLRGAGLLRRGARS